MKKLLIAPVLLLTTLLFARNHDKTSGFPIPGTITFSSTPFTGSPSVKTSFTSGDYIYAKLEIPSGTIKEAFKLKDDKNRYSFLKVELNVMQNGEVIPYGNSRDFIMLNDDAKNGNVVYVDILPEPSKATTLYSMLDDFSAGNGKNPITGLIYNGQWPDGDYKVSVKIYAESFNAYGSLQESDKWPAVENAFNFKFREDDVERLVANTKEIERLTTENAFKIDKLPPVFSKPGALSDPNATAAKIAAILKRDLPDRQIIKWVAETYNGPYWSIATDDFGLPKYKYFNPHIWMAYKMDGKCYVGYITLRQNYAGGGTYSTLQVAWTSTSDDKPIDCIKVK